MLNLFHTNKLEACCEAHSGLGCGFNMKVCVLGSDSMLGQHILLFKSSSPPHISCHNTFDFIFDFFFFYRLDPNTHPLHSQTTCLLTSSLSLGVPVPHGIQYIQVVWARDTSVLPFSLSLHRHPYICVPCNSPFISYNKNTKLTIKP